MVLDVEHVSFLSICRGPDRARSPQGPTRAVEILVSRLHDFLIRTEAYMCDAMLAQDKDL